MTWMKNYENTEDGKNYKSEVMELLTDNDVMLQLGIKDKQTLKRYRRYKGLDFIRYGRTYKYTQEMIDNFIMKHSSLSIK